MALAAGRLRHYIEIQQPVTVINTAGEREQTWQHVTFAWAEVAPVSVRDFVASQQNQSKVNTKILVRSDSGLRPNMRVLYRNAIYDIEGILPDKDSGIEYMTFAASTGVNEG